MSSGFIIPYRVGERFIVLNCSIFKYVLRAQIHPESSFECPVTAVERYGAHVRCIPRQISSINYEPFLNVYETSHTMTNDCSYNMNNILLRAHVSYSIYVSHFLPVRAVHCQLDK